MQGGTFAQEFKNTFPSVFSFIPSLKIPTPSRQLWGDDKERPHRLSAKALQRAESDLKFSRVILELRERGKKPVITIHDSILTTSENGPAAETVIREQFGKVGFNCGVRMEPI